jgi:crotonobetainyl-CoA:carnitine CoA-transferase CaiB-like acyl-CoA transferase
MPSPGGNDVNSSREATAATPGQTRPLEGLRVIDAGTTIAGPFAATLLADYGADVVSIEKPGDGDPVRRWPPYKEGESLWWKVSARNKRLVTLDMRRPAGRELFLRLVSVSDAVIENYRPGTFARWGLSYTDMAEARPGIVVVRVTGYGQSGPYAKRPGYGTIAEAMSGIPSFTGFGDRPPTMTAYPFADMTAGLFAVIGLLAAIYSRDRNEVGCGEVDVSLYESCFRLAESQVVGFDQAGIVKSRIGNRIAEDSPRNTYKTSDGAWIAISASSDQTFHRLAAAMDQAGLSQDARFSTNLARIENNDALDEIIGAWIGARSSEDVMSTFEAYDVVAGKIYTIEDIFSDPHYAARGDIVAVEDPQLGEIRMGSVTPRFTGAPNDIRWPGAALGQHNDEVYGGLLGLSAERLEELATDGVI